MNNEDYFNPKGIVEGSEDWCAEDGTYYPFYMAKQGDFETVKYLVEYSAKLSLNTTDNNNRNLLHYAVLGGSFAMCEYLVRRCGMSPVSGDINLVTPYELIHEMNKRADIRKKEGKQIEAFFEEVTGARYEDMYHNPIVRGMHPDPSIVRVGEDYYMVNSSFVFFPCIPISHSKDLVNWKTIGYAITNPDWARLKGLEGGRGYWAPDISYFDGRFYIAATYRLNDDGEILRKQMVTSADKPEGPYCEPVFFDEDGIDPSIFTDDDNRRYMLLNRGARIFEISADGKKQLSKAEMLFYGDYKRAPEGPHLLKHNGYYYLIEAEGGTGIGHRVTVSRSKTLKGYYEPCPYNPIMRQENPKEALQACGHGKIVQTAEGEWYMTYLCKRQNAEGKYLLGRETALDKVEWTADGWPIVNRLQGPSYLQKKPAVGFDICEESGIKKSEERGGFSSINPLDFVTVRYKSEEGIITDIDNGDFKVMLKASRKSLSSMEAENLFLIRQTEVNAEFEAALLLDEKGSLKNGQHAGILGYYDENSYVRFSLEAVGDKVLLSVQEHLGKEDLSYNSFNVNIPEAARKLYLKMVIRGKCRKLLYAVDDTDYHCVCTLDNVFYLCDEGIKMGKRFTGPMLGIYAYAGDMEPFCQVFSGFKYTTIGSKGYEY